MRGPNATTVEARPVTPEEFGDLFEAHASWIHTYLFRRTADWAQAEDLTSVVFLEAWRRRADVDLVSQPALPWLCGVATNVLRNQRRSLRRHRAALERLPATRETPDFAEDAASRLDDERVVHALLERLAVLSQDEQDVVALCCWQDMSYEDAAHALDVPVGTVRSRLSRARQRLGVEEGTNE
jgi:RNA polymerase sigma-70 factor (ECF subfamily)